MANLYIESRTAVFGVFDHLYLVYKDDNGAEYVIRGQPTNPSSPHGNISIQNNTPIESSNDARGSANPVTDRGQVEINLGGRNASEVWELAKQHAALIADAMLPYEATSQNSNSVIASILQMIGVDVENNFPYPTSTNPLLLVAEGNVLDFNRNLTGTSGYDSIHGWQQDDNLLGGDGNDTLYGLDGNDVLVGGTGSDKLDGGNNIDTVSYASSALGVTIDLSGVITNSGGDAEGDVLLNIENAVGSTFSADVIKGNSANNKLEGGGGNDQLYGGMGVDHLYGGDGNDVLHAGSGDVNPINGAADVLVGGAGSDTYVITRGESGRIIIDDAGGALLFGRQLIAGEAVYVGANQWTIRGHNATMQGGDLVISGPGGNITLANFSGGAYGITLGEAPTDIGYFPTTTNTVPDPNEVIQDDPSTPDVVEYAPQPDNLLEGTAANDNITSSMGSDTLRGEGGDDVLNSGSGFFTEIYGGIGNDWIGASSAVTLEGNDGNDTISALLSGVLTQAYGGIGNDRISLGSGTAYGEDGHDYLFTMNGAVLIGGEGRDTIISNISDAEIRIDEDMDGDQVVVSGSNVSVFGGVGDDTIVAMGAASGIKIYGGDDSDILFGGFGNDTIYGGDEDGRFGAVNDNCVDGGNGVRNDIYLAA